ncbi:MAG: VWA domain-containing protein [Myxococcales bacterium]|nr:VWA domain-containing protein [Myxococcales bacterium]
MVLTVVFTLAAVTLALAHPWLFGGTSWFAVEWQRPYWLFALVAVPPVWWWTTFGQDHRRPRLRVGTLSALTDAPRGVRTRLRDLPGILRSVAIAMFVLAIARPVSVTGELSAEDEGVDMMVAIDLSHSMSAVLDADPRELPESFKAKLGKVRPTRIDMAKLVIQDFIARRRSDRIGAVVFGREAYILSPPTLDYTLLSKLIGGLRLDVIDGTRTAIGDSLGTAVARLELSEARSKVVILLTDGDSNAGKFAPEEAIREASRVGCKVYTIQIGSGEAAETQVGVDPFGQPIYEPRVVPVNPELLARIAKETRGQHFVATDATGLRESMHAILDQLEKTRFEASAAHYQELFALLLVPGVVLIGLEALLRAWLLRRFP